MRASLPSSDCYGWSDSKLHRPFTRYHDKIYCGFTAGPPERNEKKTTSMTVDSCSTTAKVPLGSGLSHPLRRKGWGFSRAPLQTRPPQHARHPALQTSGYNIIPRSSTEREGVSRHWIVLRRYTVGVMGRETGRELWVWVVAARWFLPAGSIDRSDMLRRLYSDVVLCSAPP